MMLVGLKLQVSVDIVIGLGHIQPRGILPVEPSKRCPCCLCHILVLDPCGQSIELRPDRLPEALDE